MKRLKTSDYQEISHIATNIANSLIAGYSIRKALLISNSIHEKILANYKRLKEKYPDEY